MALKKSELYSSLWQSCDELRGGMDASQYKDYVLALLFIKYVSDKYAGKPYEPIEVPKGSSFRDMVALKGTKDIGDDINKKIVKPLQEANKLPAFPSPPIHPSSSNTCRQTHMDILSTCGIAGPARFSSREIIPAIHTGGFTG